MPGVLLGCPCFQAPAAENAEVFYTRTDLTPAQTPRVGLILEMHSAKMDKEISTHCREGVCKNTRGTLWVMAVALLANTVYIFCYYQTTSNRQRK